MRSLAILSISLEGRISCDATYTNYSKIRNFRFFIEIEGANVNPFKFLFTYWNACFVRDSMKTGRSLFSINSMLSDKKIDEMFM